MSDNMQEDISFLNKTDSSAPMPDTIDKKLRATKIILGSLGVNTAITEDKTYS